MEGIIFIGIQATGKSTFYKKMFFNSHIRINLDMLKTRNRENILLDATIAAKQPVVIDNTNPTVEDRKKYIDKFSEAGFKIIGYYFKSSIEDSIRRNEQRTGDECIPVIGICSTHKKLQLPSYKEGFDKLYYVTIDENAEFILEEWQNEV